MVAQLVKFPTFCGTMFARAHHQAVESDEFSLHPNIPFFYINFSSSLFPSGLLTKLHVDFNGESDFSQHMVSLLSITVVSALWQILKETDILHFKVCLAVPMTMFL
jgi:hypothetical protein